jgi:hypothetical protein
MPPLQLFQEIALRLAATANCDCPRSAALLELSQKLYHYAVERATQEQKTAADLAAEVARRTEYEQSARKQVVAHMDSGAAQAVEIRLLKARLAAMAEANAKYAAQEALLRERQPDLYQAVQLVYIKESTQRAAARPVAASSSSHSMVQLKSEIPRFNTTPRFQAEESAQAVAAVHYSNTNNYSHERNGAPSLTPSQKPHAPAAQYRQAGDSLTATERSTTSAAPLPTGPPIQTPPVPLSFVPAKVPKPVFTKKLAQKAAVRPLHSVPSSPTTVGPERKQPVRDRMSVWSSNGPMITQNKA